MAQQGDRESGYSNALDNFVNVFKVHNMMVGPAFDQDGNLRMVVQLINKKHMGDIEDLDIA